MKSKLRHRFKALPGIISNGKSGHYKCPAGLTEAGDERVSRCYMHRTLPYCITALDIAVQILKAMVSCLGLMCG